MARLRSRTRYAPINTSHLRYRNNRAQLTLRELQVFLTTPHSFALVNLKPLLPGHVLVCPARPHRRLTELSAPELTDLFSAVQRVQRMLARHYFHRAGGSFNIALQDGPEAGQTVPHVHVHVIPRIRGATDKPAETPSDELYDRMAAEDGNVGGWLWDHAHSKSDVQDRIQARPVPGGEFPRIEDADRMPRPMEVMVAEAELFRRVLSEMDGDAAAASRSCN